MLTIKLLAFVAVIAIYVKWNYSSPILEINKMEGRKFIIRSIPPMLFVASGVFGSMSLMMKSDFLFYTFFVSSAICLVAVAVITIIQHK